MYTLRIIAPCVWNKFMLRTLFNLIQAYHKTTTLVRHHIFGLPRPPSP